MSTTAFVKMHGLGNDFVVIDARRDAFSLDRTRAHAIADRKTGIGCDQLIVIEKPQRAGADVFMRIHNADGGEVEACGNATRCIATLIMAETGGSTGAKSRSPAPRTRCMSTWRSAAWPIRSAPIWATRTRRSLSPMR